ncbi:MAG: dTMP kinase [Pseudomonadota bacterium]|nr:dTMP kinase [Pseudomonadota bacterium]
MFGKFITLEGIDGAGKSTHLGWLQDWLRERAIEHVITREPGGTPLGEKLRELLLHHDMHLETETLLMFAGRREHIAEVILPALQAGSWVVSDRFTDATFAYQGGGRGLGIERIEVLEHWVQSGLQPDLTLLFDVPLEVSRERLAKTRVLDRFEQEQQDFHQRVRNCYLERARRDPARIKVIDSTRPIEIIQQELATLLQELI